MLRKSYSPTTAGLRQKSVFWLILTIVILLLANTAYYLFFKEPGTVYETREKLEKIVAYQDIVFNGQQSVVSTLEGRLLLMEGNKIRKETKINGTISGMAVSIDKTHIFAGTTDRKVYVLDDSLQEINRFDVNGRVVAIDASAGGDVVAAFGIGTFTDKFWIGQYDLSGKQRFRTQIGFDVTAVKAGPQKIFFGTADSKVGLLDETGKELWRKTLYQPITRLALGPDDQLVAADNQGNVTLLSGNGKVKWTNAISKYPITQLGVHEGTGLIYAADKDGSVYILSMKGELVYGKRIISGSFAGIHSVTDSEISLLTNRNEIVAVSIERVKTSGAQSTYSLSITVINVLFTVLALFACLLSFEASRKYMSDFIRRIVRSRSAYVLILPSLILIVTFSLIPTVMAVFYSFSNFSLKEPLKMIGFDNFVKIRTDHYFWVGFWNMIWILITSVIKELTMPLLAAELIFWLKSDKVKYFLRTSFIVPSIVPGLVVILLWKMIYNPDNGMINQILGLLGLDSWKHAWLGEEKFALLSVIMAGFPFISIFSFLVYFGGLIGINKEIFDSANMDGVGSWQRFKEIDFPLLMPQIRLIMFFTFIGSIQGFANIYIFTHGGPGSSTYVPGLQMYDQISSSNFGYASAIGFVLAVFVLIATFINSRISKKDGE